MIALQDPKFNTDLVKKEFPSEERLLQDLKDVPKKVMGGEYQEKLITKIGGVLNNKKIRLSSILEELREKILPLIITSFLNTPKEMVGG